MEQSKTEKEKFIEMSFVKKIEYSITKFEKYPEMAALGLKKAIKYLLILVLLVSIVLTAIYVYYISEIETYEKEGLTLGEKFNSQIIDMEEYYGEEIVNVDTGIENSSDISIVISLFISIFIITYFASLMIAIFLSVFGELTCRILKIKMNYKYLLSMTIYSITLSTLLLIIYAGLIATFKFEIKYFDVMYMAISYICLATAIFMIKSDVIKQQIELMKGR